MRAELFAVDATSVQVCWRSAPPGPVTVTAGPSSVTVESGGGPGGAVVDGLEPGTSVRVRVSSRSSPARIAPRASLASLASLTPFARRATTLARPPGRELCRFAAINDLHVGATEFGPFLPMREVDHTDPHAVRCARAAIGEATAWGAAALVVKGDITQEGRPNEWEGAAALLAGSGLPVLAIEGNHDTKRAAVDGRAIMAAHGLSLSVRPTALDLPGVRIVAVPTAPWHADHGRVGEEAVSAVAALIADARAAVVALHHYPQRFRVPTLYPAGIPGHLARRALDAWAEANPATLVIAGHTHRHRRREHGPLVIAESGSTKDFPGTWTGYVVHEGGIMQVTRRVLAPTAIAWTERGRHVLGGLWGWWSPGVRSHRCFSHTWPR